MTQEDKHIIGALLVIGGLFLLAPNAATKALTKTINDYQHQPIEVIDVECVVVTEKEPE
jgi:hypothetical protein